MLRVLLDVLRFVSRRSRSLLAIIVLLTTVERLLWAVTLISVARNSWHAWVTGAVASVLWIARGLLRQSVSTDFRFRLTVALVETAFHEPLVLVPVERTEAAIFEGRFAAEQTLTRTLPSAAADGIAIIVLLLTLHVTQTEALVAVTVAAGAALLISLTQKLAAFSLRSAWDEYLDVSLGVLTGFQAAVELVASGRDGDYVRHMRARIATWTQTAAKAERRAALLERAPVISLALVALVTVLQKRAVDMAVVVNLAIFLPLTAALVRGFVDFLRTAPKIETLSFALGNMSRTSAFDGPFVVAFAKDVPPSNAAALTPLPGTIRFSSVSFSFAKSTPLIGDLSFEWRPGTILGVRGANGAGKSSLLKLLLGLLRPSAGKIDIAGTDLQHLDLRKWRQSIAYLPQRPYLPERLTVRQVFALTSPDFSEDDARAALQQVQVWPRLERLNPRSPLEETLGALSGGERQRVVLARALAQAQRSRLIFLDEPDENLDSVGREILAQIIRRLASDRTIAIATHDVTLLGLADTVVDL